MATIKSVFGNYADKLQVVVDRSLDQFAPTWFEQYFDWGTPQLSLNYTQVIGASRIEAAASVVARGSKSPLRSRAALEKLTGTIPPIQEKFQMTEEEYRNFLTLQQLNVSDESRKRIILDMLFGDVRNVGNAAMKRIDLMCLEGISTGKVTFTTTNNPDGVVTTTDIDLLMPADNKTNAAVTWATAASATPITDFMTVREAMSAKGRKVGRALMSRTAFTNFIKTTEVKNYFSAFYGKINNNVLPALGSVNEFLSSQGLPTIEIVDRPIGVEKDGVIATVRPFSETNVAFLPDGKVGMIHNAIAVEELKPVEKVAYAKFNNALISKWQENEPWAEYTKVELNAFPGFDVDGIHLLSSTAAFA